MTELFLRLPGGMFMSIVDGRFLLGTWTGDEYGGDIAEGDVAYGGDAMVAVGEMAGAAASWVWQVRRKWVMKQAERQLVRPM